MRSDSNDSFGRRGIDEGELRRLYVDEQRPVAEVAAALGTSRVRVIRNLENYRVPIRAWFTHDAPLVVLDSLYGDPLVTSVLDKYGYRRAPQAGSVADRFGSPAPRNDAAIRELYVDAGLSVRQIELVTGIPAKVVGRAVRESPEFDVRPSGMTHSPASRRYRSV